MQILQQHGILISLVCALLALVYGVWSIRWILAKPAGNARMQEIAEAILFLSAPQNSYMTGHLMMVDGGWTAFGAPESALSALATLATLATLAA